MYFRHKFLGDNEKTGVRLHQQRATHVMAHSEMMAREAPNSCCVPSNGWHKSKKRRCMCERGDESVIA